MICLIDDQHIPVYRIVWISDVPHFCGDEECLVEGRYEVRLEQGEAVFGNRDERDKALEMVDRWQSGVDDDPQY